MKHLWVRCLGIFFVLMMSACSASSGDTSLPTVAILPSATDTGTPLPTRIIREVHSDLPPTWTLTPSATTTRTPSASPTSLPSWTPVDTSEPTSTLTPTPEGDAYVSNEAGVHVRRGPSTRFNPPLETLDQMLSVQPFPQLLGLTD